MRNFLFREPELIEIMKFQLSNTLRGAIAGVMLAFAIPSAGLAQDISESHFAAARSALQAIHATDPYDVILPAASERLKAQLIADNIDLDQQISQIVDDQALALVSRRSDLEKEAARIYASSFTEEELKTISDFYNSDAGKKLLESGPIAAREISEAARVWGTGIERDLLANVITALNDAGLRPKTDGANATVNGEQPSGN